MAKTFDIPSENKPSNDETELTKREMAELGASRRNVVIYERLIKDLQDQVAYFQEFYREEKEKREKDSEELRHLESIKRAKIEIVVQLFLVTAIMTIGSTLIAIYPRSEQNVPWQFLAGILCIILAFVFGVVQRLFVWCIWYKWFFKKFHSLKDQD
ncbi:MAG: DUF1461 domain-containing protein [Candidatus Theseobacter exili]|nr:DUF1461 domain-containing protein [Candidatus Theseobacter exili]